MANGDVRIEWVGSSAWNQILTAGPVVAQINSFGAKYTAKANATLKSGAGYIGAPHTVGRAIFNVYTRTGAAKIDNSRRNTLAKLMP